MARMSNLEFQSSARGQRGAVLIVAMILLMVLTILGVAAMNTTSLEEKMASNSQERTRALQSAESGVAQAFGVIDTMQRITPTEGASLQLSTGTGLIPAGSCYTARFIGAFSPPAIDGESTYDSRLFQAYYFDIQSEGYNQIDTTGNCTGSGNSLRNATTNTGIAVVNGGAFQIVPKPSS